MTTQPALSRFTWEDPFLLDAQLSQDDRMLRDAAAQFAQAELAPRVIKAYRDETTAPELFPLMGGAGLLGSTPARNLRRHWGQLHRLWPNRAGN